ncbi:MAG: glycosyltransferase family 2 protein [Thermoanaerobaculia bacterium]|nr:glycosyltransferase family 2 protein [Thermoanaerobaculia bacterium]
MISALLVSYNTRDLLAATLERLLALPDPPDEVLVADNGSTDGTLDLLAARFPGVRVLPLAKNLGFGAANNRAAAAARGDKILLLNSDAWPLPGTLARLSAALDRDPRLALAAPHLRYPDGGAQFHWAPATGVMGEALQKLRNPLESWRLIHRVRWPGRWFTAACALLRREAFAAVGGFDEGFFLYFEDVDLCTRLLACGWKLRSVAGAEAVHLKGGSRGADRENLEYRRGQLRFYAKHRPGWENRFLRARLARRARRLPAAERERLLALLAEPTPESRSL